MIRVRMRVDSSVAKRGRYRHVFAQTRTPIYTDQQDPNRGDAGVLPGSERPGFCCSDNTGQGADGVG